MLTRRIWSSDYYKKGERVVYQGVAYRVEAVQRYSGGRGCGLTVSVLQGNEGDAPIECIIATRFGKPGENFMGTVERLMSP